MNYLISNSSNVDCGLRTTLDRVNELVLGVVVIRHVSQKLATHLLRHAFKLGFGTRYVAARFIGNWVLDCASSICYVSVSGAFLP